MTTAYGYCRVSTISQAEEGVSLDAQRERIIDYCKRHNLNLIRIGADEGVSGKKASNRPELNKIMDEVCRDKAVLVVYSLSRWTRSIRDLLDLTEQLQASGANFVSLTENVDSSSAMGRFTFQLLGLLAQLERELIGERTKEALRHKRAAGYSTGGRHPPYGFVCDADGKLYPVQGEQDHIGHMIAWRASGESYGWIARELNGRGIQSKGGGKWSAKVVRDVLLRTEVA